MNERLKQIDYLNLYRLLWDETLLLDKAGRLTHEPHPSDIPTYVAKLNAWRAEEQLNLLSCMCSFNPSITQYTTTSVNTEVARSFWQQGLLLFIKTEGAQGQPSLITACQRLHECPADHILRMTAYCISRLLLSADYHPHIPAFIHCFIRFDHVLSLSHESIDKVMAENLLRDLLFYIDLLQPQGIDCIEAEFKLSQAWNPKLPLQGLQARVGYYARKLKNTLTVKEEETYFKNKPVFTDLIPLLDGLLFLQSFALRAQIEARYQKCSSKLLIISVPVQKLMAECLRLAVYDR